MMRFVVTLMLFTVAVAAFPATAQSAEPDLLGTHIGGWVNRGVVFVLKKKVGARTPIYEGHMQITQGGDRDYGQKTSITAKVEAGKIIVIREIDGVGTQTGTFDSVKDVKLGGTDYHEYSGRISGPGTGDTSVGQLRILK